MVLKEIPSKASSEGKPLLTVTTKKRVKYTIATEFQILQPKDESWQIIMMSQNTQLTELLYAGPWEYTQQFIAALNTASAQL
ncbi:hypothetical protein D9C73_008729 [Collichthys lucidus]|uniref:Uncharacterized protein n=1 Tax=Collichthys lucidus TaxID=240159 RepID=A0A4U5UIN8_COLLU|nr:hypothetical protein D9C73_008729 [Collichthys lucidus]